jgi:hypothetical protein
MGGTTVFLPIDHELVVCRSVEIKFLDCAIELQSASTRPIVIVGIVLAMCTTCVIDLARLTPRFHLVALLGAGGVFSSRIIASGPS